MTEQITGYPTTFAGLFDPADTDPPRADRPVISRVEIPLVQRDYAQGRVTDKVTDIRSTFLEALREALVSGERLSLDFVYGDVQDGVFLPLDGQQRLTTLFLLHWYVAVRTGQPVTGAAWTRFSYATRPSARLFCERLAAARPPAEVAILSEWLVDQPWYLYVWEHDPTIRSMLVVLDDIARTFGNDDLDLVWTRLVDRGDPAISFYVLPIPEMGAGDDLYITMNSRGKPLTDFENFKAKFEQVISHSPRASRIAHKIDGAWSDVLWPFHGGDNIVDDEFLRYFSFLIEICEWRRGLPSTGRLVARAEALVGADAPAAEETLEFLESAFDTWVGENVPAYFHSILRTPSEDMVDERPVLFTPEGLDGVNLFEMCCRTYGNMRGTRARVFPLGLTLVLYAVLSHRLHHTDEFPTRLRVLRNLVEASDNEIRLDNMPALLDEVDGFLRNGDLGQVKTFNQAQVADEQRKAAFLAEHPQARQAIQRLEDHRLLRGCLLALDLDALRLAPRAEAFTRMFAETTHWTELTGALLACGDYYRRRNERAFSFGSPTGDSWWRVLLTGPMRSPREDLRQPLGLLLDRVAAGDDLADTYRQVQEEWLGVREQAGRYDWRYHLVKYPEMREGTSGIYVSESGDMGYGMCALRRSQLNSNYRDPYLLAILRRSGVEAHRVNDPWFFGYQDKPRWLTLKRVEIGLRCVEQGLVLQVSPELRESVGESCVEEFGLERTDDGYRWPAPQREIDGHPVDTVDRIEVGARLLRRLVSTLDPNLQNLDKAEAREELRCRGVRLSEVIGGRLGADLASTFVWQPRGAQAGAWVGFKLADGNTIELVLRWTPQHGVKLEVKAYPDRPQELHPDFDHLPLGLGWSASDDEVAEAFLGMVDRLREAHSRLG